MSEICNCCGKPIRGCGTMCENCRTWVHKPDAFLNDGTPLYLKTSVNPSSIPLQLAIYEALCRKENKK
jgi:hypothetical protein